ncbi:MAG: D-amino acid aminotransferase, partial [Proteobacteria bacterium]|nr:D-amino acid aminotransferase [Pseudomonadota bacterium]
MPRVSYVNGRYLRHADAGIHIEDRGFQFSDGIYEVIAVANNALVDLDGHMARLDYSLRELRIKPPVG